MSLLSTDIAKVKRLSLKEVKLPSPERIAEPIKRVIPPTAEERAYSRLVETKPDKETLIALAQRLIKGEAMHSKEEIIQAIEQGSKVSPERAERGFNLMLEAGAFELIGDSYYLTGSTPF